MVGRLVQQQDIRLAEQELGKLDTHAPSPAELGGRPVEILTAKSQADQRPFQLGMVVVSTHHLEMFRQMRDTVYEVLIRFRFIICPLDQLLVQPFYLLFHLMDMLEGMFRLFAYRLCIRQLHLLGKITDRRLLRYADRPGGRRLQAGKYFQHRRFSRTVLSHQCDTILLIYHKRNMMKKRKPAKLKCKSFIRNHIFSLLWLQRYNLSIIKASTLCRGFFIKDPVPSLSCFSSNVHAGRL